MSIKIENITYKIKDGDQQLAILDNIDFALEKSEVAVITGKSGSGKSTLLSIAGLLKPPLEGRISIDNEYVEKSKASYQTKLRRNKIGFIFQSSNLFPSLNVLEQLEIVSHIGGNLNKESKKYAMELLDRVGMSHRLTHLPIELSGGEKQRVAIARALMNKPSILIADEPTSSLDDERSDEILKLLMEQTKECATVIVTHNEAHIPKEARVYLLEQGKLNSIKN